MINQPPQDRMLKPREVVTRPVQRPVAVLPKPETKPAPQGAKTRDGRTV